MTPEKQRIAIAEWCGYTSINTQAPLWFSQDDGRYVPDYCSDLNAMHEAEKMLKDIKVVEYGNHLNAAIACGCRPCDFTLYASDSTWHATAAQRAEALLRTIGKWEE